MGIASGSAVTKIEVLQRTEAGEMGPQCSGTLITYIIVA